jgi:hypothetical protein
MNNRLQKFFLGTIIISIFFWQTAFTLATSWTILFSYVFIIIAWILAFFFSFFFLSKDEEPKITKWSYLILLLPILWFIAWYYEWIYPANLMLNNISFILEIFIIIFGLPFLVFMSIIHNSNVADNTISNNKAYFLSVIISTIIGCIWFLFWINSKYLLKCSDLEISWYLTPSYCITEVSPSKISNIDNQKDTENKIKNIKSEENKEEKKYTGEEIEQYIKYYYNEDDWKYYFPNK